MTLSIKIYPEVLSVGGRTVGAFWVHLYRDGVSLLAQKTNYGDYSESLKLAWEAYTIAQTMKETAKAVSGHNVRLRSQSCVKLSEKFDKLWVKETQ